MKKQNKDYDNNELNKKELILSFNIWIYYSSYKNSYNITNQYKNKIKYFNNVYNL